MQIQSGKFQRPQTSYSQMQKMSQQTQESPSAEPTETFTFSGRDNDAGRFFLGMGVMMTGMMIGAASGSNMAPAIMMGSMFGGMAIMFS